MGKSESTHTSSQGVAKLEIFISYASEDVPLAISLHKALSEHLDSDFTNVWIDIEGIRAGFGLNDQIRAQLDKTDVLIVVYTGQQKESHGFTGLEIGYFIHSQTSPRQIVPRRMVSFFLREPPGTATGLRGVPFGIDESHLSMSDDDYRGSLANMKETDPIPSFLEDLESDVDAFRKIVGLGPVENSNEKRLDSARSLLTAAYGVFKTRKESETNPQKKIVLIVKEELSPQSIELPPTSIVTPEGSGVMSIFGLPDKALDWSSFLAKTPDKYRLFWKDTIEYVILSSLDRLDADNSQIIISEKDQTIYRVILSRAIRYYNGDREFHLYFVEILRRNDFGDEHTTNLLKALGLCCRFRFMFFEKKSEFSADNFSIRSSKEAQQKARRLIRELNLLRRDSMEAQLDDPIVWAEFLEWPFIAEMNALFMPLEDRMRTAAAALLCAQDENTMTSAKQELIDAIARLQAEFKDRNGAVINQLATQLGKIGGTAKTP